MTTTAAMKLTPSISLTPLTTPPGPIFMNWKIAISTGDLNVSSMFYLRNSEYDATVNMDANPYATFSGDVYELTVIGLNPDGVPVQFIPTHVGTITGMYTASLITFFCYVKDTVYTFMGQFTNGRTINGQVYKGDPTDDGSWSATAQGNDQTPPKTN